MPVVVNTKSTAYVFDEEGHVIGGFQWADLPDNESRVQDGLANGRLVVIEQATEPAPPEAAPVEEQGSPSAAAEAEEKVS